MWQNKHDKNVTVNIPEHQHSSLWTCHAWLCRIKSDTGRHEMSGISLRGHLRWAQAPVENFNGIGLATNIELVTDNVWRVPFTLFPCFWCFVNLLFGSLSAHHYCVKLCIKTHYDEKLCLKHDSQNGMVINEIWTKRVTGPADCTLLLKGRNTW